MRSVLPAAILFSGFSILSAQTFEGSISVGQQLESNATLGSIAAEAANGGGTYNLSNGFNLNFRATLNTWKFFGHEFGYSYNRTHLNFDALNVTGGSAGTTDEGGMAVHQGVYDFLGYGTPEGSRFRPFGAAGIHFSNYVPPGSSVSSGGGQTKFGINYGGGLKARISGPFGVRIDVHQYTNGKPGFGVISGNSGWIRQTEISAGIDFML